MEFALGPGFSVRFERLPEALGERIAGALAHFRGTEASADRPVTVRLDETGRIPEGEVVIEETPLSVQRDNGTIYFVLPGIQAWCQTARGVAGIRLHRAHESELDLFVALVLAPLLVELGVSQGWIGIHAASVSVEGTGLLLPGPSGAGKSTIFANVHRAGHGVLSDDLTFVRPVAEGWRLHAFPRPASPVDQPTADDVPLQAIVAPHIVATGESQLSPLPRPELIGVLLSQTGFLSGGSVAEARLASCARIASSVPGYRLAAGPHTDEVPPLLERLVASLTSQATR